MGKMNHKTMHREVKLSDWGNIKAIRLTNDVLEEAGLNDLNDVVFNVEVESNKIILTLKDNLTPFQKLFEGYKGDKPQKEPLWDEAGLLGKERL